MNARNGIIRENDDSLVDTIYTMYKMTGMDVCFVELYTKANQADIPPVLLARLRVAVETIKAKYNR